MTTPPTPEAVEAARIYARDRNTWRDMSAKHLAALSELLGEQDGFDDVSIRILAAEVERLRAQVKRQGIDLISFTGEVADLRAKLKEAKVSTLPSPQ